MTAPEIVRALGLLALAGVVLAGTAGAVHWFGRQLLPAFTFNAAGVVVAVAFGAYSYLGGYASLGNALGATGFLVFVFYVAAEWRSARPR